MCTIAVLQLMLKKSGSARKKFLLKCTCKPTEWQKWYYDRATSSKQLMPGDIVLMKLDTYPGKRKVKDQWSQAEYEVVCQVADDVPRDEV